VLLRHFGTRRPLHERDHYWKPVLKSLGLRTRRAYSTRHTHCTVALMAGVPPAYIAAQVGHSVKMLLEVYARWIPSADGGAAKRLLAAAMGDWALEVPQMDQGDARSLIPGGKIGRRDWTRTKKPTQQAQGFIGDTVGACAP
jgi:integrase